MDRSRHPGDGRERGHQSGPPPEGGPARGGEQRHGPEGTEFLDLELSRVVASEAARMAREVGMELVREAMKARLRERLGERLARLGELAADQLADDAEANLRIEAIIGERRQARKEQLEALRRAFAEPPSSTQEP